MNFEPLLLINPSTEEVIDTLDVDEPDEITAKVDVAREHVETWGATSIDVRKDAIRAFGELLHSNRASTTSSPTSTRFWPTSGSIKRRVWSKK